MPAPYDVVIVPGFGGTSLSYRGGFRGKTTYWYNPVVMGTTNPLAGALASDGMSPYPILGKTLFVDGPVNMGIYEPLLTNLANNGHNAYFWGYDWRLGAVQLAAQFAAALKSISLASTFSVVAHSYGGLVAQLAYPTYTATPPPSTWGKTVYLGTPHGGAHWAAMALAGYFPIGSELATISAIFNLLNPALAGLKSAIFTSFEVAIAQLLGSWPGLYCCLPNPSGPWSPDDPNAILLQDIATYKDTWGGQQVQWFTAAAAMQQQVVANLGKPRPSEICFVGSGFWTPEKFAASQDPDLQSSYSVTQEGDGTVTVSRGTLRSDEANSTFVGTSHNRLVNGAQAANDLLGALGSATIGSSRTQTVQPPFSTLPNPPLPILLPPIYPPQANRTGDP